jgi:hypothetical protein
MQAAAVVVQTPQAATHHQVWAETVAVVQQVL